MLPDWLLVVLGGAVPAVGVLVAYLARLAHERWLAQLSADRDRWKPARLEMLRDMSDVATKLIELAREHQDVGHVAWSDERFREAARLGKLEWKQVQRRALLLVAHRETLQDIVSLDQKVLACLPPMDSSAAWDVATLTRAAERNLQGVLQLVRTNELRLEIVGIPAIPDDVGQLTRWRARLRWWERERHRG